MGQKVNPNGFRTGVIIENGVKLDWKSHWSATKREYPELLVEDQRVRKYIKKTHRDAKISSIRIERTREKVIVIVYAGKVGMLIGPKGAKIEELTNQLQILTNRLIEVKTMEVSNPQVDAQLVAEDIAEQLEKRQSFRRCLKRSMETAMGSGARGIKVQLAGRLGGSEMARCEKGMLGSVPLSTLRAKVNYGFSEATTPQGNIGIKVWMNNGDYLTEEKSDGSHAQTGKVSKKPQRQGQR